MSRRSRRDIRLPETRVNAAFPSSSGIHLKGNLRRLRCCLLFRHHALPFRLARPKSVARIDNPSHVLANSGQLRTKFVSLQVVTQSLANRQRQAVPWRRPDSESC